MREPVEGKPSLEQAIWVIECIDEGWKKGYSMRGIVSKVLGYTEPGAGSLFQIAGLLNITNALVDTYGIPSEEDNLNGR